MSPSSRNLAILFADITASTKLYDELGNAVAQATIDRCLGIVKRVCDDGGGRVIKTIGDEVMAAFPTSDLAAQAASEIQQKMTKQRTSQGSPIALHIGFHSGSVIEDGGDVFGDAVNVAARLAAFAKGGQIFTSAHTVGELSPALKQRTRDQDAHTLKGKEQDIGIFELIWQESEEELTAVSTRPAIRPVGLKLTHGAREVDLDHNSAPITLGRDAQNDLVIMDRKASRLHARIERRRDKFVIVDVSSNGTFCTMNDEPEIMLRREELILRGSGRISFGHAYAEDVAEAVVYVCL